MTRDSDVFVPLGTRTAIAEFFADWATREDKGELSAGEAFQREVFGGDWRRAASGRAPWVDEIGPLYYSLYDAVCVRMAAEFPDGGINLKETNRTPLSSAEVDDIRGMTLLGVNPPVLPRSSRLLKRATDIAGAGALLLISSPLLLILAIAIKLDSPGPVLFRQSLTHKKNRCSDQ